MQILVYLSRCLCVLELTILTRARATNTHTYSDHFQFLLITIHFLVKQLHEFHLKVFPIQLFSTIIIHFSKTCEICQYFLHDFQLRLHDCDVLRKSLN